MDTSTVGVSKQTLAVKRRRRMRTVAEKRGIVEEVLQGKDSVAVVARRHEVNANLVFSWKRQYEAGLLGGGGALLAVEVHNPSPATPPSAGDAGCVEIELGAQRCVRVRGDLARGLLDRLVAELCGR